MIKNLTDSEKSEIIEMALSDHTSFENIKSLYGLSDEAVKRLMRKNLSRFGGTQDTTNKIPRKFTCTFDE